MNNQQIIIAIVVLTILLLGAIYMYMQEQKSQNGTNPPRQLSTSYEVVKDMDMPNIGDIYNAKGTDPTAGMASCNTKPNCAMFTLDPYQKKTWFKTYPTAHHTGKLPLVPSKGKDMYIKKGIYSQYSS